MALDIDALPSLTQDYLKAIFQLAEWDQEPVTATRIAAELGLKPSTTTEGLKRLESQGLITREPYRPIELTASGREAAVHMVRRHRLIEAFLVSTLGYSWDEVHDEAERLEHAVSPKFIDKIEAVLGQPERDPHGDPIPDGGGRIAPASLDSLADVNPGETVTVERISDKDPQLLRYLAENGVVPGTEVTAGERPIDSLITVRIADAEVTVSAESASMVRITRGKL